MIKNVAEVVGQTVDVEVHSPEAEDPKNVSSDTGAEKNDEVDQAVVEEVAHTVEAVVTESQPEPADVRAAEAEANELVAETMADEAVVTAAEKTEEAISEDDQAVIAETETSQQVPTVQ